MAHVPPADPAATRDIVFTKKYDQYLPGSLVQVNDIDYKLYVKDKEVAEDAPTPSAPTTPTEVKEKSK